MMPNFENQTEYTVENKILLNKKFQEILFVLYMKKMLDNDENHNNM